MNKDTLKDILPPLLLRKLTGMFYGWHGNYNSWSGALNKCKGYGSPDILKKVRDSALKVKEGSAAYERDSVLFEHIEYSYPVLSSLLWIASLKNNRLDLLDFGGSLGSSYFQNRFFLESVSEVNWCVVEQAEFVRTGVEEFENEHLHFLSSIQDCFNNYGIDVVLFSSVLQYLEDPYGILSEVIRRNPEFIIIDRTPFISGSDRITIQKVHPKIYKADYPCRFFNEEKFISFLCQEYSLIVEFDALDKANIKSKFKGYLFRKKSRI